MREDARRHARRRIAVEVRAKDRFGLGHLFFDSLDLSEGGAFLRSDVLFEDGEGLELELAVGGRAIHAPARVAWVRRVPGDEAGMGVEFVELSAEDREAIASFLATLAPE